MKWPDVSAAARAAGIARRTHYAWLENDEEYREAFAEVEEAAADELETWVRRMARRGNFRAAAFLLGALRPEKYRKRLDLKHGGEVAVHTKRIVLERPGAGQTAPAIGPGAGDAPRR
jgi:hypothetical protein